MSEAEIHAGQWLDDRGRCGTLHGEQRVTGCRVHDDGVAKGAGARGYPAVVLECVRGVDDHQKVIAPEPVHENVVHERAELGEDRGVLRLTRLQLRRVVAEDRLDGGECVLAGDFELAHVRDVEQTGAVADGEMFLSDAGVFERHLPAAELHHLGARRDVAGMQRCLLEHDDSVVTACRRRRAGQSRPLPLLECTSDFQQSRAA